MFQSLFQTYIQTYLVNLKQITHNISLLYRNFLHWNISKICIFLYVNIAGFILSLPFIIALVVQYFQKYSSLLTGVDIYTFLDQNFGTVLLSILLFLIIVAIFISTYTYGYFLLLNVYKGYLQDEKLPYTKNLYLSWKHFSTYLGVLGWASLYLLLPIVLLLVVAIPFGVALRMDLLGSLTSWATGNIIIGGASLLIFVAILVWFVHLAIRLSFAYVALLYSEQIGQAKSYVKAGFALTKWKVWKIILLSLPFLIILGIFINLIEYGQSQLPPSQSATAFFVVVSYLLLEGITAMIYLSIFTLLHKKDPTEKPVGFRLDIPDFEK